MNKEDLLDALSDAILALSYIQNRLANESLGIFFNDISKSIATLEELQEQVTPKWS